MYLDLRNQCLTARRAAHSIAGAAILVVALVLPCHAQTAAAIAPHTDERPKPKTTDNPHDTDSLYKLLRRSLGDKDPHATMQAYYCEASRLTDRLGQTDGERRVGVLVDTVDKTPADKARRAEVTAKLRLVAFDLDAAHCGRGFDPEAGFRRAKKDTAGVAHPGKARTP